MIGHYLLALSPEAEELVLRHDLRPSHYTTCLVGVVVRAGKWFLAERKPLYFWLPPNSTTSISIEGRFDLLCYRFGYNRINRCIRQRILANRAHRAINNLLAEEVVIST